VYRWPVTRSDDRRITEIALRRPDAPTNREKLPKIALVVGIPPFSGSLELAKARMNATILGGSNLQLQIRL
jgi:hypothetical protein